MFDVFEAARLAGVQRIVYASTITRSVAIRSGAVSPALPPRPDSLYGTFKAWGEAMLRCYFDRHGIGPSRCASGRIGRCRSISGRLPHGYRPAMLRGWLTVAASSGSGMPGGERLFRQYTHEGSKAGWDVLGYRPQDNAEDHIAMLRDKGIDVDGPWEWAEHGGSHARAAERPPHR